MRKPRLIAVTGPPGAGKSTLARALAAELGCPAILRDEVKQGMAATLGPAATDTDALNVPVMQTYFSTLGVLLRAQVTVVAEAAYQDRLWRPGLQPLADIADLWVIRCHAPARTLVGRIRERATRDRHRAAHADEQLLTDIATGAYDPEAFAEISLDARVVRVDTSDGYQPNLIEIATRVQAP
ncbi:MULTISPECIES: AAA family ATPase [unclassified Streptomyces]|uniref:AAA family ATPase n=1 Tax=unclassified Streptomyces TaxID=2593676 RepID=UPI002E2BD8CB|nr:AAA family ATPase [Streptomyces sp. NBC_01439]